MYFVVLPLSALGPAQFNIATYVMGPIGIPFSWGYRSRFVLGISWVHLGRSLLT
jgi:hypothetical protein